MTDKTTSTTELQNAVPASVMVEINDGSKTQLGAKLENPSDEPDSCLSRLFQNLSLDAQRSVMLLRKLQREQIDLEVKFYAERHMLDTKYEALYSPLFEKRKDIVTGVEDNLDVTTEGTEDGKLPSDNKSAVKGIDRFWLMVFLNSNTLSKEVHPGDESILQHLKDMRRRFNPEGSMNFVLEFHFEPNDYFTNSVLTKEYDVRATVDEEDPYGYDGPRIIKCRGCTIDWKEGKNITTKTIRKKKLKGSATTKVVKRESFFNFFNPPQVPNSGIVDDEIEEVLMDDFEVGEYIKDRIIPRAVLYYTKEADSESDESEEEDSPTDSSEEFEDKSKTRQVKPKRKGRN